MMKNTMEPIFKQAAASHTLAVAAFLVFLFLLPITTNAEIAFEDVSTQAGISKVIQTAGSAWGDVNRDGWPDIWVSNHDYKEPSLYLNMQDGTFREVSKTMLANEYRGDFHGAAWADFDNDGDQDLIITTGGGAGRGKCPNFLLVNENGVLTNHAERFGVDYPLGRGRTPLWFDADRDGKLDLLLMNRIRPSDEAPSAIFLQTASGFKTSNGKFGFNPVGDRSRVEKALDLIDNAVHLRIRKGAGAITSTEAFAQLADLSGDRNPDLISYVEPMRVYSMDATPFEEITNDIGFPHAGGVQDVAIADFNGDGQMDMFLSRAYLTADVVQIDSNNIRGLVKGGNIEKPMEVRFRAAGNVTFTMDMPWADPTDPMRDPPPVFTGQKDSIPADGRAFTVFSDDPSIQQGVTLQDRSVSIVHDPKGQEWTIRVSYPSISFTAAAENPISRIKTSGFTPSKGGLKDMLLTVSDDRYRPVDDSGVSDNLTPSFSVAAGDFDNDMDVDLYVVCTEPTRNIPNILYENDGTGHFKRVADAGAAGSSEGRGDRVSVGDYDRDGFLDLFVTNGAGNPPFSQGPHQLFHNKTNGNRWLEIDLKGVRSNRDGIGCVVELEAGGVRQIRTQGGGIHSFSQDHQRLHFGLAHNTKVDKLTVRWPAGGVQELKDVSSDQIIEITEMAMVRD